MKNSQEELVLRTDRLAIFGLHLIEIEISSDISLLEDLDHLFNEADISVFPVFKDVVYCLPKVFPGEWELKNDEVVWNEKPEQSALTSIVEFFQIEQSLFLHLMVPHSQLPEYFGGEEIDKKASAKTIGYNFLEAIFCLCYLPLMQPSILHSKN